MFSDIMWGSLGIILITAVFLTIRKRKRAGVTGFKSALTPICFFLIAFANILAYFFGFMGLLSWLISVLLFILAAHFTKFLPVATN
ncbi:hypothetical protein J32TS6_40640 [Virgibacillus pantothenticus]|uniref:hypothetical protein n=2 Tax=Virgibacillus TaxID=84406 RepID=UPI001B2575E8|nr:hypothetical protein [Virgibacillus pantothenticus]MEB5453776.1 hypothetical protein [Virgibacillus pantothenticus]MEB5458049.1 hypothetical protein [Virgibacillus pantothenticus]MEB5462196.1 hypothetical protein [Virgibacillus pantothenticus]MEB5466273.1 hypothetical protein [Virgibacillus pantothenticus]MEB5470633.1 hypothetical protein [Virgibacillus pantothenticus]